MRTNKNNNKQVSSIFGGNSVDDVSLQRHPKNCNELFKCEICGVPVYTKKLEFDMSKKNKLFMCASHFDNISDGNGVSLVRGNVV